jgi:hypothetical protein
VHEQQIQQARDNINNVYRLNEKKNDKLDILQRDMSTDSANYFRPSKRSDPCSSSIRTRPSMTGRASVPCKPVLVVATEKFDGDRLYRRTVFRRCLQ